MIKHKKQQPNSVEGDTGSIHAIKDTQQIVDVQEKNVV